MKDEMDRRIMTDFVALAYAYETHGGRRDKKCKGVKKYVMKKMLDFEDYKHCLFVGHNIHRKQLMFWNKLHEVSLKQRQQQVSHPK